MINKKTKVKNSGLVKKINFLVSLLFIFVLFIGGFNTVQIVVATNKSFLPDDPEILVPDRTPSNNGLLNIWGKQNNGKENAKEVVLNTVDEAVAQFNSELVRQSLEGGLCFSGSGELQVKVHGYGLYAEGTFKKTEIVDKDSFGHRTKYQAIAISEMPAIAEAFVPKEYSDLMFITQNYVDMNKDRVYLGTDFKGNIKVDKYGNYNVVKSQPLRQEVIWYQNLNDHKAYKKYIPDVMYLDLNHNTYSVDDAQLQVHKVKDYVIGYTINLKMRPENLSDYEEFVAKTFSAEIYNMDFMNISITLNRYGEITSYSSYEEAKARYVSLGIDGAVKYTQNFNVVYREKNYKITPDPEFVLKMDTDEFKWRD